MTATTDPSARPPGGGWLTIGQLAAITGVAATTLRYYERLGLITPVTRVGGQRRYDDASVTRVMVLRFASFAGLSLEDIGRVVNDDSPDRAVTRSIARRQVERIDGNIRRLRLARSMMVATTRCTCPTVERCDCGAMAPVLGRLRSWLVAEGTNPIAAEDTGQS